jgi:hypothetical protein
MISPVVYIWIDGVPGVTTRQLPTQYIAGIVQVEE